MKILITGISGFVGSHLVEYIDNMTGHDVYGIIRHRSDLKNLRLIEKNLTKFPKLIEGNITDSHSVNDIINEIKPDKIFHLAAQSFVPYSWRAPNETLNVNIIGTLNILEAVRNYSKNSIVLIAGTSEEYGLVDYKDIPIKETTELKPLSPYGVSKVASELLGFQYYRNYGVKVIRTRAFNHEGPRRGREFVISQFIEQTLKIRPDSTDAIKVGNLTAIRDFTDVRDVVDAYWLATELTTYGEVYNICSGVGRKISEVLDMVIKNIIGVEGCFIAADTERMRPFDVPVLIGDCTKFRNLTGWSQKIEFETTVNDMIEHARGTL